jgi:hypothetical protein
MYMHQGLDKFAFPDPVTTDKSPWLIRLPAARIAKSGAILKVFHVPDEEADSFQMLNRAIKEGF